MLAKEESLFPAMYANLRRALVPLMDDDAYAAMGKTSSEVNVQRVLAGVSSFFLALFDLSLPTSRPVSCLVQLLLLP